MAPIGFPAVEQTRLSNGLRVVLVPRPGSTTDNLLLRLDSGTAGSSRLIAPLAMDMLAGKAPTPDQRDRAARVEALGGRLGDALDHDHADLTLSMEAARLAPGIAALGDLLAHPGASADAFAALRKIRVGQLAGEGASPNALAGRLLNNAIYGPGHPYASGASAEADVQALEAIDVSAVQAWNHGHLRPDRATLYVAADTSMAQLRPLLERSLAGWRNEGPAAAAQPIPPAAGTATPSLIVIDRPGATQTFVMAGKVLPGATGTTAAADLATEAANDVFGGNFTSRIGTNLRHDKGWTYGIGSGLYDSRGERRWILAGSVDRDHTGASIAEIIKELRGLTGDRPPDQGELDRIATTSANQSAAKLEGNAELLGAMAASESDGQRYDEIARRPAALHALTIGDVRWASASLSNPAQLHWVLVGDWKSIRNQLGDLKLGDPVVIDPTK